LPSHLDVIFGGFILFAIIYDALQSYEHALALTVTETRVGPCKNDTWDRGLSPW
jgi:hypothetical protein